jgi:adenylate cyclase class IV
MTDLIEVIRAFEVQNSVMVTITGKMVEKAGKIDLQWEAKAWETKQTLSGRQLLGFASVRCTEKRLATMEAVVLQLLYALDFQIGEGELARVPKQKA